VEDPIIEDEVALKNAGLATDGEALVRFFRKRSLTEADLAKLRETIQKLGDDSYVVREEASADLVAAGRVAVPLLQKAAKSADPEIARRARDGLAKLEADDEVALVLAAARLLGAKKPAGAVEALLGYAPFAEEEAVEEEVLAALAAVGIGKDGKAAEALVKTLADKAPARRAAAAFVVARSGDDTQRAAARDRLRDAAPPVRWRAAQGLLAAHDPRALPALIVLLTEALAATAGQAEDLLRCVAGDKAPATNGRRPPVGEPRLGRPCNA
jgi:HEAT repeat protein